MVASNLIMEHKQLAVSLGTYGNDVPSCINIAHGKSKGEATISFERTLRVPDNQVVNNLPPSLGQFPLFSVADYQERMPAEMAAKGGIFLPMYQREAMWIKFSAREPFALKIYVGGVNAISGVPIKESPEAALKRLRLSDKITQDYVVLPEQPWLDGIASDDGRIRQFVAMPKGSGYSVEAQVTGEEKIDGMQFELTPVKRGCPVSLNIRLVDYSQSAVNPILEKLVNLQEKRLSDMSTMLDLKKVVEKEFGINVEDQGLQIVIPNHSPSRTTLDDDQVIFAELWLPDSSVLHVHSRKTRAQTISVSTRSSAVTFGASASVGGGISKAKKSGELSYSLDYAELPPPPPPAASSPLASATAVAKGEASAVMSERKRGAIHTTAPLSDVEKAPIVQVQAMSLAAGGLIKQSINADPYPASIWDPDSTIMFNVQLLNSESFMAVTGRAAPSSPIDAKTYQQHGYPFFDIWNEELSGVKGDFGIVKSVGEMDESKSKAEKINFWEKMTGESKEGKEESDFKRDEPLNFPVIKLNMSLTRTFKPIKQMEEEAKKLKESN